MTEAGTATDETESAAVGMEAEAAQVRVIGQIEVRIESGRTRSTQTGGIEVASEAVNATRAETMMGEGAAGNAVGSDNSGRGRLQKRKSKKNSRKLRSAKLMPQLRQFPLQILVRVRLQLLLLRILVSRHRPQRLVLLHSPVQQPK